MMKSTIKNIVLFATMALMTVSCVDNNLEGYIYDGVIRYNLDNAEPVAVKSAQQELNPIILKSDDGNFSITLQKSVRPTACGEEASTKAAPVTGRTLKDNYDDGSLQITAFKGDETYISQQKLTFVSQEEGQTASLWKTETISYWPETGSLDFWSWAPYSASAAAGKLSDVAISGGKMTFTYTSPKSSAELGCDAELQKDVLLAYDKASDIDRRNVNLMYKHALSAICFQMESDSKCTVNAVILSNIYGSATCTFDGTTIEWGSYGNKGEFKESFGKSIEGNGIAQSLSTSDSDASKTFLLIPQSATEERKVTLSIIITMEGETEPVTLSAELDPSLAVWEAGYTYTYSLGMNMDYVLQVYQNVAPLPHTGGNLSFSVESYSNTTEGAVRTAVPWTLEYYDTLEDEWLPLDASSVPSTLFDDTHTFSTFCGYGVTTPGSKENVAVGVKAGVTETIRMTVEDHNKKLRAAPVVGTEAKPYDLSMHTVNAVPRATGAPVTANCYVVAAGGWYCLPLVYGNAYNGSTTPNTVAYAPSATTNKATYLTPFRNAVGTINPDCAGIIETDTGVSLTSASVQWEDLPDPTTTTMLGRVDVMAAPEGAPLNCKYMRFYVSPEKIRQGNIILKVTDGTTTYWSWHIWVTDDPISTIPIRYGNSDSTTLETMSFNLGWCDGSETLLNQISGGDLRIRVRQTSSREPAAEDEIFITRTSKILSLQTTDGGSVYYEWGRKDPMMAGVHISSFESKPYLGTFDCVDRSRTINEHNIAYAIQHPGTFLGDKTAKGGMWYYEGFGTTTTKATYQNLWDAGQTGNSDKETVKTIYDPCPPGFKVPRRSAYQYMSTNTAIGGFQAGYLFKKTSSDTEGTFFYGAGYRNHETGGLASMGTYGHYWVATATTGGYGHLLRFKDGTVEKTTTGEQQCNGYSIRPVME